MYDVTKKNFKLIIIQFDFKLLYNVTYQGSPVTRQLNGASLLYSLISATMTTIVT
jgi:hypothetical protein